MEFDSEAINDAVDAFMMTFVDALRTLLEGLLDIVGMPLIQTILSIFGGSS